MKFKKPKFWDLEKPNFLSLLLLPLTLPVKINNFFLNKKTFPQFKKIKTICVGNIYIGGTGKTPTTIKLFKIMEKLRLKVCVGKKFYPSHIDEKMILEKKSKLICSGNRRKIISIAIEKNYDFLIFDDGLQDKTITYDLQFVCFDSDCWIGNGELLPSGPLREKITSLKKYDAIFLKTGKENGERFENIIKSINPNIKVFETTYEINNINNFNLSENYLIFSGIGNPKNFKKILIENKFKVVSEIIFPDHFSYNQNVINKIRIKAKGLNAKIITTEKDFLKISKIDKDDINFIDIDLIIKNEKDLINFLKSKIYE